MTHPTSTDDRQAVALAVADGLHRAAIHLLRQVRREDPVSGLSPARISALSVLVFGGPRSLSELAAAEQVRPPTMSRLVQALEAQGLVERRADPEDGRAIRLLATEAGRDLLAQARRRRIERLAAALNNLALPELRVLQEAVELLSSLGWERQRRTPP